jgi:hypothetical protein
MTISSSYNYSTTRDDLIKGALRILGVISQGQTPDATQVTDAAEALNQIVKAWSSEGLPIWLIKKQTITLTATNTYAIGLGQTVNIAKPLRIYQALLHGITDLIDIPLQPKSQEEYTRLSQKSSPGQPIQYYYESLKDIGNLYIYPVPDANAIANKNLQITYSSPLADFDTSTDEPDIPQEGIRALKWALASELAFEYGYPSKDRESLHQRAAEHKFEFLCSVQEESSLYFKPDIRRF